MWCWVPRNINPPVSSCPHISSPPTSFASYIHHLGIMTSKLGLYLAFCSLPTKVWLLATSPVPCPLSEFLAGQLRNLQGPVQKCWTLHSKSRKTAQLKVLNVKHDKIKSFYHMIQQSSFLEFTQRSWKLMFTQNLHVDVDSSFIHNCQNLEAIKMSVLQ